MKTWPPLCPLIKKLCRHRSIFQPFGGYFASSTAPALPDVGEVSKQVLLLTACITSTPVVQLKEAVYTGQSGAPRNQQTTSQSPAAQASKAH